MTPPLVLCDPPREPFWPLAATRPVADLLAGTRTFRARWTARAGPVQALWCDPAVTGCAFRSGDPPSLNRWPDTGVGLRVALATWLPPADWDFGDEPAVYRSDGAPVAWLLDADLARRLGGSSTSSLAQLRSALTALDLPSRDAGGSFLPSIWSVMAANPQILATDAVQFAGMQTVSGVDPIVLLGDDLHMGPDVSIGPFVVLDARLGPIVLDRGARVEPHTVCRGPLYVGPESVILGGPVGLGTTIGPCCKVRGEVEASIFQGYANKAHDGFIGHSVFGEWVNLGADTVTSDLKNTYGPVRISGPDGRIDTGLLKVGAFLGDHVKTGIGSLLTTGARLGVATHFFGGREVSPAWVPEFTWYDGRDPCSARFDAFLKAANVAMARRGQVLTEGEREMLAALHAAAPGMPVPAA